MLRTKVEHFFGSQERHDLQLVRLTLDTSDYINETEAIENGWLIAGDEWYQCRSVRIDVDEYLSKNTQPFNDRITVDVTYDLIDEVKDIYEEFCDYREFSKEHNVFSDLDRSKWFIVRDRGVPVAFTKMIMYRWGLESQYTAWNYHEPKLSLGRKIVWYEANHAASLSYKYLYIGQGYERGSAYKADFAGFEWWNGMSWSQDKEEYKRLCYRDSTINNLEELTRIYNDGDRVT